MSADTVIKIEGLGKRYVLGSQAGRPEGLRHALQDMATRPFRWLKGRNGGLPPGGLHATGHPGQEAEFWALKDVSLEVKRGQVVGIIGRNGAGKSTLLKVLSRITEPTRGRVEIDGRVASLLEVGTGFHPELTGRENIFLNGAILGMSRAEVRKKFDEIVDFAEVEKFLDTPVKRYSSGMYVRLAFAVAAHLEPEILIVDEVLAVGDAQFQKKCLGKMSDVARSGERTVLFVSHNMQAVRQLCNFAYLLDAGTVASFGPPPEVAESYLANSRARVGAKRKTQAGTPMIESVDVQAPDGSTVSSILAGQDVQLKVAMQTLGRSRLVFGMTIFDSDDIGIFSAVTSDTLECIPADCSNISIQIPTGLLNAGRYRIEGALVDDGRVVDSSECYSMFEIQRGGAFDLAQNKPRGILRLPGDWSYFKS